MMGHGRGRGRGVSGRRCAFIFGGKVSPVPDEQQSGHSRQECPSHLTSSDVSAQQSVPVPAMSSTAIGELTQSLSLERCISLLGEESESEDGQQETCVDSSGGASTPTMAVQSHGSCPSSESVTQTPSRGSLASARMQLSLQPPLNMPLGKRCAAWRYFQNVDGDPCAVECQLCHRHVRRGRDPQHLSTTVLQRHLQRKHPNLSTPFERVPDMGVAQKRTPPSQSVGDTPRALTGSSVLGTPRQVTLPEVWATSPVPGKRTRGRAQEAITSLIGQMVAVGGQPFSLVEDISFRHLMRHVAPWYSIPSLPHRRLRQWANRLPGSLEGPSPQYIRGPCQDSYSCGLCQDSPILPSSRYPSPP